MRLPAPIKLILYLLPLPLHAGGPDSEPVYAGKVSAAEGEVRVQQSSWQEAYTNLPLKSGAVVRTYQQSRAWLLLADEVAPLTQLKYSPGTELKVNANTRMVIEGIIEESEGWFCRLVRISIGQIWGSTRGRPGCARFRTPSVNVAISGSEFDIRADGSETTVTVLKGTAVLENELGRLELRAALDGPVRQGIARLGEAPRETALIRPEDAVQWTLQYSASVSPRDYPFRFPSPQRAREALQGAVSDPLERARLLCDAGRLDEALAVMESTSSAESAEIRGWIYLSQNRLESSIQEFEKAPGSIRARLGLSIAHYRSGRPHLAYRFVETPGQESILRLQKAFLDMLAGNVQQARQLLEPIAADDESFGIAQAWLSSLRIVENDSQGAVEAARRAVDASPGSPSAHLSLSRALQSRFDLDGALQAVEDALRLEPESLEARIQYARLLFGQGLNSRAESLTRELLADAPDFAEAHSLFGFILLARARSSQALDSFQQARKLDSTLSEPCLGMGLAMMRQGRTDKALEHFLEAVTLDPRISVYHSYLAKAAYELRQFERAFSYLDEAKRLDANDPTPFLYAGILSNDLRRPGWAVGEYRRSIERNDNRAVYRSSFLLDQDQASRNVRLADAYRRLGLTEQANLQAIRSTLSDASNSSARLFLAETFLGVGLQVDLAF